VLGNPSDGYYGRTLSIILRNFRAKITLQESRDLRIDPGAPDLDTFRDLGHLAEAVEHQGYYGGARLIKAAIKVFHDYCDEHDLPLPARNFTVRYESSVPRQVGLGGSSAIVTAALRALMTFYQVEIPLHLQPNLILSAELDELGITAGLQDRVVQVYEGVVYMDFSREIMEELGYGAYEALAPSLLPGLYVAFQPDLAKVSGRILDDLRIRWEGGDREVRETLRRIAALAARGREALLEGRPEALHALMDENFDLRRRIMEIREADVAMVEAARALGASAKLAGSGGSIIGVLEDPGQMEELQKSLGALGAQVIEPSMEEAS
jgi:glucuronokinase